MDNVEKILSELHEAVAQDLLDRVRAGTATASDMANALKMLKDNNITVPEPEINEEDGILDNLASYLGDAIRADIVPNVNEYEPKG